jgi:hypothetical protein
MMNAFKMSMNTKTPQRSIISVLIVYLLVICQPSYAAMSCADIFKKGPETAAAQKSLWAILDAKKYNGEEVIEFLSHETQLKDLFAASAGVWEGYSIKQHTLMVFEVFAEQFSAYQQFYQFKTNQDVRLSQTLKFAIALHDIGKPYAIQAGNKNRQHEFTVPILEKALSHFGFSENETRLAKALVGNDIMGDLVKGIINAKQAKSRLAAVADEAGMPLGEFVPLQFLFYTIDAASYPTLRQRIFTTSDGLLVPNRSQFQALWDEIQIP